VVGRGLDTNTMQLQYLETLKQVGTAPSTKIVVPMELLGGIMNGLRGVLPGESATGTGASGDAGASGGTWWVADSPNRGEIGETGGS